MVSIQSPGEFDGVTAPRNWNVSLTFVALKTS